MNQKAWASLWLALAVALTACSPVAVTQATDVPTNTAIPEATNTAVAPTEAPTWTPTPPPTATIEPTPTPDPEVVYRNSLSADQLTVLDSAPAKEGFAKRFLAPELGGFVGYQNAAGETKYILYDDQIRGAQVYTNSRTILLNFQDDRTFKVGATEVDKEAAQKDQDEAFEEVVRFTIKRNLDRKGLEYDANKLLIIPLLGPDQNYSPEGKLVSHDHFEYSRLKQYDEWADVSLYDGNVYTLSTKSPSPTFWKIFRANEIGGFAWGRQQLIDAIVTSGNNFRLGLK